MVKMPAAGPLSNGVSYAAQVLPWSRVAKTRAIVEPPVPIHALLLPSVVTQVPLEANEASPGNAGGMFFLMLCHVIPSRVRRSGKVPFTESLCTMPRFSVQNANAS